MDTFTVAAPDFEARVRASFAQQGAMHTLGVSIGEVVPGRVVLEMAHTSAFSQQDGFMHAGALATVLDSACGYAAFTLMPADARVLTIEFKINLLAPAHAERYVFEGLVTKPGRTITVCDGTAWGISGDTHKRIATLTGTMMAVKYVA